MKYIRIVTVPVVIDCGSLKIMRPVKIKKTMLSYFEEQERILKNEKLLILLIVIMGVVLWVF